MTARPARRRPHGFTLIEMMVALFIMVMIGLLASLTIRDMYRNHEHASRQLSDTSRLQNVMAQWDVDLAQVFESQQVPPIDFNGAVMRMTRRHEEGAQVVAWRLSQGVLWRWVSPVARSRSELLQHWEAALRDPALMQAPAPGWIAAMKGVPSWQVYFYRDSGWTNPQSSDSVTSESPEATQGGGQAPAAAKAAKSVLAQAVRLQMQWTPTPEPGQGEANPQTLLRDVMLKIRTGGRKS